MSSSSEVKTLVGSMYKNFPKCPVCGHDYAYDFSWEGSETYARCRLCGAKWLLRLKDGELIISRILIKTRRLGEVITILGLMLLSAGIFSVFLLNTLLGMFFAMGGIVITLIGVALPSIKKKRGEKLEKKLEKMYPCPQCNKEISKNFKICPYCRFDLKSRTQLLVCPSCGKKISSRFKLCPYCRERLKK